MSALILTLTLTGYGLIDMLAINTVDNYADNIRE